MNKKNKTITTKVQLKEPFECFLKALSVDSFGVVNYKNFIKEYGFKLREDIKIDYDVKAEGGIILEENIFQMRVIVKMTTPINNLNINVSEITTSFDFFVKDLKSYINENQSMNIPANIMAMFNSVSLSTTRGLLYSKLSGTFISGAILPLLFPKDIRPTT